MHTRRPGHQLDRRLGRVLTAAVADEAWRVRSAEVAVAAHGAPLGDLVAAARHHRVAGYLEGALRRAEVGEEKVLDALARQRYAGLRVHLAVLGDLPTVGAALAAAEVPWAVVKGPVLAAAHPRADLRTYTDLDLLVHPEALPAAVRALEGLGGQVLMHRWQQVGEGLPGEVPVVLPSGTVVDLHWHLVNEHRVRRLTRLSTAALLARGRAVDVGAGPVPTLDPEDTVVHLALHACLAGGDRLVWLVDVARALTAWPVDWDVLARRADRAAVSAMVAVVLDKARRAAAAPVPPAVVASLAPSRLWLALGRAADATTPPERSLGAGSPARVVTRSTRADLRSSGRELSRRVLAGARDRWLRSPPAADLRDAGDPNLTTGWLRGVADEVTTRGA